MSDTRTDTREAEAAALDAAIELRRHVKACSICGEGLRVCPTGRLRLGALNARLADLGDDFATRARAARPL